MGGNIMGYFFAGLCILIMIAYAVRIMWDKCSPVRSVNAIVVHKQPVETFSKYSGNGKYIKYSVTFLAGNKKLSFYVSEISYKGYKINESGTLKYKGSRLIDFS